MSYADDLRDPRWQRVRLEVMADADFRCEWCGRDDLPLEVHHLRYVGRKPWETPKRLLRCVCEDCHGEVKAEIQALVDAAGRAADFGSQVSLLLAANALRPGGDFRDREARQIEAAIGEHFRAAA